MRKSNSFLLILPLLFITCENETASETNTDQKKEMTTIHQTTGETLPLNTDGSINAIIEISAGSVEKWEMNKTTGKIERDSIHGEPRTIHYLGYPGNYGMIPSTFLPQTEGGDGDPLDVLVLGPPVKRGTVVKAHLLGVLQLLDNGEQDDKLIAISDASSLQADLSLDAFAASYPGALEIIETWFLNYKGPGQMESSGFADRGAAESILAKSIDNYK